MKLAQNRVGTILVVDPRAPLPTMTARADTTRTRVEPAACVDTAERRAGLLRVGGILRPLRPNETAPSVGER